MPGGRQLVAPRPPALAMRAVDRSAAVRRCRTKFLDFFPDGMRDETYLDTERSYKWNAHVDWRNELADLLASGEHLTDREALEAARLAVRIEARTNLLFSFEKMAVRDAVASARGARAFVRGLARWQYGSGSE